MKKEPYVALVASVIKWSVIDNQICTKDILFFMYIPHELKKDTSLCK